MNREFTATCGWGDSNTHFNQFCYRTQYGCTAPGTNLELHVGNHLYLKRGALRRAFVFDNYDYRYETLLQSLGLPIENRRFEHFHLGTLIDCDRADDAENNKIYFRITEQNATHLLIVVDDEGNSPLLRDPRYTPDAIAIDKHERATYLVYSLARKNTLQEGAEFYDDKYDDEPDDADLTGYHWNKELTATEIIQYRLQICGF